MDKTNMTPYKRVIAALHGERPDKIPFTVYECLISQCSAERILRNRGLCIVKRIQSYKVRYPNVKTTSFHYADENGKMLFRTEYSTPFGKLSILSEPAGFTTWTHEYMFKGLDDYKSILFMIKDAVIEPDYAVAARLITNLGEDFIIRDQIPLEPLQRIINDFMGTESFCYEWADNRDEVLKLYNALVDSNRRAYTMVANGPLEFANYGGNVVPQIVGREGFKDYYIPNYNEAAEILHNNGKLIGCHLDADNTPIMDLIGETELDYIEAYDPGISPSTEAARKAWPGKVLWLNWPSAWHLECEENVRVKTLELMKQATPCNGFIIGITEDVPEERWQGNYMAIMDGMDEFHNQK